MAVKIGSARSDEKSGITGGRRGDQKGGKEVSTQNWYLHKKGWVIIRLKDAQRREKCAYAMQAACDNNHFGYSQNDRLSGYKEAAKVGFDPAKVAVDVNVDCSELVRICLAYAGVGVTNWYTGSMISICRDMPETFEIITGDKAKTSDYLLRGDILVTASKGHTVVVLSDGAKAHPVKTIPDISHHHPVRDWAELAGSAQFAISKATQGTTFVDPSLDEFIRECERRHVPYWLYAYLNKGDELTQTKRLVSVCKAKIGPYFRGYAIDVEAGNNAANVALALAWLASRGERCMVYTGYSTYDKYKAVIDDRPDNVAWWEARYGKNDGAYKNQYPPHEGADLHQFTDRGDCPGIDSKVDLNRLTGRKPLKWFTEYAEAEPTKKGYSGEWPMLPGRGYYTLDDGITRLTDYRDEIKKLQLLINWITGGAIKVDGQYGKNTVAAVKVAQMVLKVDSDGQFGRVTLGAAKAYKK